MTVSVIGLGKLGLCIACTLAKYYKVIGIDDNYHHINLLRKGINSIKEANLNLWYGCYRHRIDFTYEFTNLSKIVFVVVPTPSMKNGAFTSRHIEDVLKKITRKNTIVVIVSTVMPRETMRLQKKYPHLNLIYNPTFIALGTVIKNFLLPDFILIGADKKYGLNSLMKIYKKLCLEKPTFTILSTQEAEIAKLALNCYITTKITFANQIGNLCYRLGIKPDNILNAIGQDKRIGNSYFKAGLGYGGPCFPRDNKAMTTLMAKYNIGPGLMQEVDFLNNLQVNEIVDRIARKKPRTVGFESLSYKRGTNVTEASPLLAIKFELERRGYKTVIGKGSVNINWEGIDNEATRVYNKRSKIF